MVLTQPLSQEDAPTQVGQWSVVVYGRGPVGVPAKTRVQTSHLTPLVPPTKKGSEAPTDHPREETGRPDPSSSRSYGVVVSGSIVEGQLTSSPLYPLELILLPSPVARNEPENLTDKRGTSRETFVLETGTVPLPVCRTLTCLCTSDQRRDRKTTHGTTPTSLTICLFPRRH